MNQTTQTSPPPSASVGVPDSPLPEARIPELPESSRIDIGFENVVYTIKTKVGKNLVDKHILKGVTSQFKAGRLTVILGASGAGKTSLLNVVSGETNFGSLTGSMTVNGQPTTGSQIKKVSGFVQQDDVILATMTSLEAITMSARLRLPDSMSHEDKMKKVEEAIAMLGLQKCRDTMIGSAMIKGVSGGERKRVSMAMELVTNPSVLFADEPTSGLDTYTAYAVTKLMKELADSGRTVVATLHQPSSEIFQLIDDLCIMSAGEILYFGPAEKMIDYFAREGYSCPRFSNPADYLFMDILNTELESTDAHNKPHKFTVQERIPKFLEIWKKSPENLAILDNVQRPSRTEGIKVSSFKVMAGYTTQCRVLLHRNAVDMFRNPMIVRAKVAQHVFFGVLVGLIYQNIPGRNFNSQVQDRSGLLFFLCINQLMGSSMGVLSVFTGEKHVFRREYRAGYYSLPTYFLSKISVEFPFHVIVPFLLVTIAYWIAGLQQSGAKFMIASAIVMMLSQCGAAIGMFVGAAFEDVTVGLAVLPAVVVPLMIFSGLFVNSSNLPVWLGWIKYISPMFYSFVGMAKNEYLDTNFCPTSRDTAAVRAAGCISGESVISNLGFTDQGSIAYNFGLCVVLWVALLFLAYIALWRLVRNSKNVDIVPPQDEVSVGTN